MIIGIAGKKGSGKDTLGKYICEKYGYKRYAFGDPVKEVCRILFGFNDEQLYGSEKEKMDMKLGIRPREAFQKIGTDFGRETIHKLLPRLMIEPGELWISIFLRNAEKNNLVITDVRFQNEADAIKKAGGIIIYLDSKYAIKDNHKSEKIDVTYDYLLRNDGEKQDMYKKLESLIDF